MSLTGAGVQRLAGAMQAAGARLPRTAGELPLQAAAGHHHRGARQPTLLLLNIFLLVEMSDYMP